MRSWMMRIGPVVVVAWAAVAQGPPGGTAVDEVVGVYAQIQQYHAGSHLTIGTWQGRWERTREADVEVALDRPAGRLRIDAPDYLLVCDGSKLRLRSPQYPGQHIEVDQPRPLRYEALLAAAPQLAMFPMPDVAFLLADQPVGVLTEGVATTATPGADGEGRPTLEAMTRAGPLRLVLDAGSRQVQRMVLDASLAGTDRIEVRVDVDVLAVNRRLDEKLFDFDTTGSRAVAVLSKGPVAQGIGVGSGGVGGQAAASGGGAGGHPVIGKPAPGFTLKDAAGDRWSLADSEAEIVVLGFWASWAPPCGPYLPAMQRLQAWADQQDASVEVVLINCGEKPELVAARCREAEVDLVCLIDDFTVSDKYLMAVLPHTAIIGQGVVRYLHSGPEEDYFTLMRDEVEKVRGQIARRRARRGVAEQPASEVPGGEQR